MATYITVAQQQVARLLQANRVQTGRNRAAQIARERRPIPVPPSPGRTTRQQPEQPRGRRRRPVFRDDLAASRLPQALNIGHLWIFRDYDAYTNDPGVVWTLGYTQATGTQHYGSRYKSLLYGGTGIANATVLSVVPTANLYPADDLIYVITGSSALTTSYYYRRSASIYSEQSESEQAFVLPVGRGAFLYVSMQASRHYSLNGVLRTGVYSGQAPTLTPAEELANESNPVFNFIESWTEVKGSSVVNRAFICTNQSIREVTVPASFLPVLNYYNPPATTTTKNLSFTGYLQPLNGSGYFTHTASIPTLGNMDYPLSSKGLSTYRSTPYTPEMFEELNAASQYVDSSSIRQFPVTKSWAASSLGGGIEAQIYEDIANGIYKDRSEYFNQGGSFLYGFWPVRNEVPDLTPELPVSPDNRSTLSLADGRPTITLANSSDGRLATGLLTCWDWNDPAYCRAMCLALGFTDADLTP